MDRRHVVSVCGVVLATVVVAFVAGGPGAAQTQPATDHTVTHVQVHENGSATWTINVRTRLQTDESVGEFEAFQRSFRENTSRFLDPFSARIRSTVQQAANDTGRPMGATNFSASTRIQSVPRTWGVVTYRFRWTNFAERQDGRLVVGDVFQGGFRLAENDTLAISAPATFEVTNVDPDPDARDNGTLQWHGERNFLTSRPRVVFEPATTPTPGGTPARTPNPTQSQSTPQSTATPAASPTPEEGSGNGGFLLPGVVAAIVLVSITGLVVWRRELKSAPGGDAEDSSPDGDGTVSEPQTDEDRVRQLLEANGGQMRQADIVETVDWSKSKTSRVLSRMAENGAVEKLELGRENVIRLPLED